MGTWRGGAARVAACLIMTAAVTPGLVPDASGSAAERNTRLPFGPGEECRFSVKFGIVRAGSASMSVEPAPPGAPGDALLLVSTARSSRFFSTFFMVEDRVESVWSTRSRLPIRFEKTVHEGNYRKHESVRFDQEAGRAVYAGGDTVDMVPGSQDVLSAFYYVRTLDLDLGSTVAIPNHADKKNYPLDVRVLGRETIDVEAGRFRCIVVEPLLKTAGLFKQEGRLTIWLTDDARRLPVLMKSKVAVGSITAELESYRAGVPAIAPPPGPAMGEGSGR